MQNNQVENFTDFLDLIPNPVCLMKISNKVISAWNGPFKELINLPEDEIEGKLWSTFLSSEIKHNWKKIISNLNNQGIDHLSAFFCDGKQKKMPIVLTVKKLTMDNCGYLLLEITDLTKIFDQDNHKRKHLIKDQRLRAHFENSPLGVIEWDENFFVTRWSKNAEKIFGWKARETIGVHINDLNLVYPEDIQIVEKTMERLGSGKERSIVSGNRNVTKQGQVIDCVWYNSVLIDEQGKMISVMSLIDDVTEQKSVQEELVKYSELLEERVKVRTTQLTKLKNGLEELVRERTFDLEANNKKLTREIVERRRAVEALKESERKFRDIVQNIPGMVFQLKVSRDGSNQFTYISPHAGELFDLPFENISNDWEFTNYIHPDDRAAFIASIGNVISNHTQWRFEGRILTPNNQIKWFQGFSSPALVGQELVLDGLMLDITEQKIAEQAYLESENHFRTLFTSMEEGFHMSELVFDETGKAIDHRFIAVNPSFEKQTGISVEGIAGKLASEVIPGNEEAWIRKFEEIVKTGVPQHFDEYNKYSKKIYSVYAYKTAGNTFASIFYDATNRKKTEEESNKTLQKYKVIFDSFPLGITILNDQGKTIEINHKAEEILGLTNKEMQSKKFKNPLFVNPDGSSMPAREFATYKALKSNVIVKDQEVGFLNKSSGDIRWVNVTAAPIPVEGFGVAVAYNDVTEAKILKEELQKSEKRYGILFNMIKEGLQVVEVYFDKKGDTENFKYLSVNPAWYKQTGITFNVEGMMVKDAIPGVESYWIERYGNVIKTGIPEEFENYNAFTDRHYLVYIYKIENNVCAAIVQDVTTLKKEQKELMISLTKYKVLFESFPLGITVTDKEGNILESNKKAEELLELDPTSSIRSIEQRASKFTIIRPDGTIIEPDEYISMKAVRTNSIISDYEMGLINEAGKLKWLNVTASPIPIDGYGIAMAYNDITDKVRVRELVEENERAYRTLFNAMSEGFALHEIICDPKGKPVDYRILDMNPAFEEMTGLKRDEIIGRKVSEFLPSIEKRWIKIYGDVALTGKPANFEMYTDTLKRFYKVFAYSPSPNHFATIFMNITGREQ